MFIQSCKNNTEPFVSFQFATVDELTNKPRCRTVVFRDFLFHDKRTNVLTFNTDMRSSKITESFITPNSNNSSDSKRCETPFFEACFYFPETWEQYRFSGQCFTISKQFKKIPAEIVTKYDIFSPRFSETNDDSTDEEIDTPINDDDDNDKNNDADNNDINEDNKLIESIENDEHHEDEDDYYPQPQEWEAELLNNGPLYQGIPSHCIGSQPRARNLPLKLANNWTNSIEELTVLKRTLDWKTLVLSVFVLILLIF